MTHLLPNSVALSSISSSLPSKASIRFIWPDYFLNNVEGAYIHPTQVHTQITISQYSKTDDSNESVGSALARFERSTLPAHKGTRTVVLRILKIITPVKCVVSLYDGYIVSPEEGKLHRRSKYLRYAKTLDPPVWSFNIDLDKPNVMLRRGLRLLWDT
jgi:hypothetical protein